MTSARECVLAGVAGNRGVAGVVVEAERFLVALGPVGGALSAAGPRGGDLARGGDRRGVWFLGVALRTGMALASLRPAGEWGNGECCRERLSWPREAGRGEMTGRGDWFRERELDRDVNAEVTPDSRSLMGECRR